ncbi:YczE/YyaS/YitT family protein [Sinomonas sp. G460-2]|uniref:membrane protein YczE n=1 Tax=Sinomonas sp. G460-2 TaxID=3393464 RepID=UPI0039F01A39
MQHIQAFLTSRRMPIRLVRLYVGLFAYGLAISLILRAGLGGSPWDVFGQGLARTLGLTFGTSTIAISLAVLLLWIPLRQRPGWGTLSNAALIGVFADAGLSWLPPATQLPAWAPAAQGLFLAAGLSLLAFASALYIGAGLGPGPRDGLMTGLVARTGWPVWVVRSLIELSVTAIGWLLGGTVGVGTAVFAFAIGPLIQVAVRVLRVELGQRVRGREVPEGVTVSADAAR